MKMPRIKFVWGASRVIRGDWHLGLFGTYDRTDRRHDGLAISVRGVLLWVLALLVAAYVAAMSGVFWIWSRNSYSVLSYADALLYPVRRAEIAEKKGRAFIAEGQELFRQQKWHEAARYLSLGLARCRDFRARLTLAQYHVMANQRALALRVLREGLTDEYPGRPYLETLFGAAEQGEDFPLVSETAQRYLATAKEIAPKDRRWLTEREFSALLSAGQAADALALAEKENISDGAAEHRVLALLALGRPAEAATFIGEWRARPAAEPGVPIRLLVRALREAGRFEEMEAALKELRELTPAEPAPRVYAVVQEAMAGRAAAASAALDDYLFRFGGKNENLMMLAVPLGEIRALTLLRRVADAAAERGYPRPRYQTLLMQAHAQAGDFEAAARFLAAMPDPAQLSPAERAWRDWMGALVEVARAPNETAQTTFVSLVRDRPWPLGFIRQGVEILLRAKRWEPARDVIAIGRRAYPASAWLRQQDEDLATQTAARKAAAEAAPVAATQTWTEPQFRLRLQQAVEASRWSDAQQLLREVRAQRPEPAWLAASDATLRLADVRIGAGIDDRSAMLAAARIYLNGEDARSRQLLATAREIDQRGKRDAAIALAREVLRRTPRMAEARRALAEWSPPPGAPTSK